MRRVFKYLISKNMKYVFRINDIISLFKSVVTITKNKIIKRKAIYCLNMFLIKLDLCVTKNFKIMKFEIKKKKISPMKNEIDLFPEKKIVVTIQKLKKIVPILILLCSIENKISQIKLL